MQYKERKLQMNVCLILLCVNNTETLNHSFVVVNFVQKKNFLLWDCCGELFIPIKLIMIRLGV